MRYISTRGGAPPISFGDVLLAGPAPNGGLYVPEQWPGLKQDQFSGFAKASYAEVAAGVLAHFTGDAFTLDELRASSARCAPPSGC